MPPVGFEPKISAGKRAQTDALDRAATGTANKPKLDAIISQIYSWNETLHVSDSSSVHHQEIFTVHIAMVYVIQVCGQLASRIRTELVWFCCW